MIWTTKAVKGFENIINYLEENWTEREIKNFIKETEEVLALLKEHPEMFQKSVKHKTLHRGLLNRLTILTYRINTRKQQIQLINIRGARQKPL
ncbi:type II toxin-antitoxin system RelE/ParE family toxin [uncultured Mucilaginibacter sp.]|uniref:type II toxin-antitoxin system RelE/ParE family toxin n=1 Tax=uncultured Mucilaginibacter sp. TaxID=797541 RepID=UPI003423FE23